MIRDHEDDRSRRWRVALCADPAMRPALEALARRHWTTLASWALRADAPLAATLAAAGLRPRPLPETFRAAVAAIAVELAAGEVEGLIPFRDPFASPGTGDEAATLLHLADLRNVAVATNLASAECLVRGMAPRRGYQAV